MTHSRATGAIRLLMSLWLIISAVRALADPWGSAAEQGIPMGVILPVAGLSFTLGVFLLTGFMSRVCGLVLACLAGWHIANFGVGVVEIIEGLIGVHLMLRGGGAWAMDIYVQKMQDRVRSRDVASREPGSS